MILEKRKNAMSFIFVISVLFVVYGCSPEANDILGNAGMSNNQDQMSMTTDYDMIIESREFKMYDFQYGNFTTMIREITSRMSQTDQEEFLNLARLYRSDQEKYQSLFEYQVKMILGDDSTKIMNVYSSLLQTKEVLLKNEVLKKKIEVNEELISANLQEKWLGIDNKLLTPMIKTRTENQVQNCIDRCKRQYDIDMEAIEREHACATAVNIGTCIATGGTSFLGNLIAQVGIGGAYIIACDHAKKSCENCIDGCRNS